MTSLEQDGQDRLYRYRAVTREGRQVRDVVRARDEPAALRELMAGGLVVTALTEEQATRSRDADRELKPTERALIMRQLAMMLEAGVSLLEALETVAAGVVARKGREQLLAVIAALRRGEAFGAALRAHAPGFPYYVYAMAEVGEAAGRISEVLRVAADQLAYEDRLRRDVVNALTYPALLACAGVAAVTFIFVEIVPRFSALIDSPTRMPMMSQIVFAVGSFADRHLVLVAAVLTVLVAGLFAAASQPAVRAWLYGVARGLPVAGDLLRGREVASWARLTSLSLANGVGLLEASVLARAGLPPGRFRDGLVAHEADLRAGVAVHVSLGRHTRLTAMDLSLVRAGQRSGTLAAMFGFLADAYDERLKDDMKRFTALAEPLAIAAISVVVGVIALSLVMALASIYNEVQ